MAPLAWASMRSMARWVLPVLVGPSTALTREGKPSMPKGLGLDRPNASAPAKACGFRGLRLFISQRNRHGEERLGMEQAGFDRELDCLAAQGAAALPVISVRPGGLEAALAGRGGEVAAFVR